MVMMRIDDAPFTGEEKRRIKALGYEEVDWGHPDVILDDPVKHFEKFAETLQSFQTPEKDDFETNLGPVVLTRRT